MKPEEAFHLLTAFSGSVGDEKREKIGEINLLNIIIKNIGRNYHPSENDLKIVSYHLESEHERINNGKLHTGSFVSYIGAILFLIVMSIPAYIILTIAQRIADFGSLVFYIIGGLVAMAAPIYIITSGVLEKRVFSTFNNINRMYLTKKTNRLKFEFKQKINS